MFYHTRILFALWFIIGAMPYCVAQTSFPWIPVENRKDTLDAIFNCVSMRDHSLLLMGTRGTHANQSIPIPDFRPQLYRTTINGQLLDKGSFGLINDCHVQFISSAFEVDDSLLLIGDGIHFQDSTPMVVVIKCSYDFVPGTSVTHRINVNHPPPFKRYYGSFFGLGGGIWKKHPSGGFYGVTNIFSFTRPNSSWVVDSPLLHAYYHINNQGAVITANAISTRYYQLHRANVEYSPTLNKYMSRDIGHETYWLDSSFNFLRFDTSPWYRQGTTEYKNEIGANTILPRGNQHLLVGGYERSVELQDTTWVFDTNLNLNVFDDSLNLIKRYFIKPDTTEGVGGNPAKFTPAYQAFDFISPDSFFFACHESTVGGGNRYTVCLTDSQFKVRWWRTISVPNFAGLQCVKATPDGGCIVIGITQILQDVDVFVAKFEGNGNLTAVNYPEQAQSPFKLYPNPTAANLFVDFGGSYNRPGQLMLMDLMGNVLQNWDPQNKYQLQLELSGLAQGVYFIALKHNGGVTCRKFVKL